MPVDSRISNPRVVKSTSSTAEPAKFHEPILKLAEGRDVDWLAYVLFFARVMAAVAIVRVLEVTATAGALNEPNES